MSGDDRKVIALLETWFSWIPGPKTATGAIVARGALPGEAATANRSCPRCRGTGERRIRGMEATCDRCGGTGMLNVDAYTGRESADKDLPLVESIRAELSLEDEARAPESGTAATARAARRRLQDALVSRLEEGSPSDVLTAAHEARERQYEAGDYLSLELCGTLLAVRDHRTWQAVTERYVLDVGLDETFRSPDATRAALGVCWLAVKMPKPIRVPPWVALQSDEKDSLWHGRTERHEARRAERDGRIREMVTCGVGYAEIALQMGVSKGRVSQIAGHNEEPMVNVR